MAKGCVLEIRCRKSRGRTLPDVSVPGGNLETGRTAGTSRRLKASFFTAAALPDARSTSRSLNRAYMSGREVHMPLAVTLDDNTAGERRVY